MADYQLKRAAQRRIDSAPELKAPPSWLEEAVASLRRGIGRAVNEGWGYDIGNIANLLRGLPEVPSSYDRRQGIFHEPEPTTLTEDAVSVVVDPTNFIGGAMLKPAARAVRRALPTAATVGSVAYAGDTEAGPLQRLAARLGKEAAPNRRGIANVIKNKGGNWLSGSVEGTLSGLKKRMDPELEGYARRGQNLMPHERSEVATKVPLNDWIDKQLTRYVKNEMATPEDPIRALAERGVLHYDPMLIRESRSQVHPTGEEFKKLGQSEAAQGWENLTDRFIYPNLAGNISYPKTLAENPWLEAVKVKAPATPVYSRSSLANSEDLGFNHLIDELSNALNPESGLPRHLLLDPKSIERVSVPQAVERVAKINEWRAAQKAEADALRANNAATVLHKEYPEKGMKWVELKPTGKLEVPKGYTVEPNSTYLGKTGFQLRRPNGDRIGLPQETEESALAQLQDMKQDIALADALKYEGDTMGHCVGGYCEDVASGRSRIYSLRDAKGQPHVTIEVGAQPRNIGQQDTPDNYIEEAMEQLGIHEPEAQWGREEEIDRLAGDLWRKDNPDTQRIVQIKGKQNRAPNPEYLPFVQDFVRSGKWSDVGDLQNAGLVKHSTGKYISDAEAAALAERHFGGHWGNKPDAGENPFQYFNRINRYDEDMLSDADKAFIADWKAGNFASGGQVKNSLPDFTNPAIINAIFKELQHG